MPHAIPAWMSALSNVVKGHVQQISLGYAFPDPNMIANSSKCSEYIVNWGVGCEDKVGMVFGFGVRGPSRD